MSFNEFNFTYKNFPEIISNKKFINFNIKYTNLIDELIYNFFETVNSLNLSYIILLIKNINKEIKNINENNLLENYPNFLKIYFSYFNFNNKKIKNELFKFFITLCKLKLNIFLDIPNFFFQTIFNEILTLKSNKSFHLSLKVLSYLMNFKNSFQKLEEFNFNFNFFLEIIERINLIKKDKKKFNV